MPARRGSWRTPANGGLGDPVPASTRWTRLAGSPSLPTPPGSATVDVVQRYYRLANDGDWDGWTDLFAEDQVMDE